MVFRKSVIVSALILLSSSFLCAQQMTRIAVIDTAQVYNTFFRDSVAVRNYEAKKLEFQNEIDRLTADLKKLQSQKVDYEKVGDMTAAVRLESDITRRASFLTEYTKAKNAELETLRKKLNTDDDFYASLYDTISRIAETEGYSLVMSLQQANAILWYSPTIDITEKVIASLNARR